MAAKKRPIKRKGKKPARKTPTKWTSKQMSLFATELTRLSSEEDE